MKRTISLLLAVIMVLTGCSQPQTQNPSTDSVADIVSVPTEWIEVQPEFNSLSDENLLLQVENLVYRETVQALNSEEYVVENVSAVYISKEYLDEVAFNSQSNVYFGYTLAELDSLLPLVLSGELFHPKFEQKLSQCLLQLYMRFLQEHSPHP